MISKKTKQWIIAYHDNADISQAEVMRQCKIKTRNDFYRIYHHIIIKEHGNRHSNK